MPYTAKKELKLFLDEQLDVFNRPSFIEDDPIQVPHRFSKKQDIEIAALFASVLAWGQRKTVLAKCSQLLSWMDNDPHSFVISHQSKDLKPFECFKHRTFNGTDTLYFIDFLQRHYTQHTSLETLFHVPKDDETVEQGLVYFHRSFFNGEYPARTRKHLPTPERKSTCKRLAMFLRWMVRQDTKGVDFGIWKSIRPAQLVCPCDIHVERVARSLKLIKRKQTDWQTVLELTANLRALDPEDPVKYDFALFGIGVTDKGVAINRGV